MRYTDFSGVWRQVRSDAPLPTAAGTILQWLSDDFGGSSINADLWEVSGSPTVSSGVLTIASGQSVLSRQHFRPPCLLEAICMMTARASSDNFRVGLYTDDNNLVEWAATGTSATNMDAMMSADGVTDNQTGIYVNAANNTYRLASIYVGLGEVIWSFRSVNSQVARSEVYRYREHGIPDGPFRVRLAGLAGTSVLKVHRVQAYQLADIIPPGALGHHVEAMAMPVRLTNTPFASSPSNVALSIVQTQTDTFASLAAGSVSIGSSRAFYQEQVHLQGFVYGDQPFTAWIEGQTDGTNWQVLWMANSADATADAAQRYFATSPIFSVLGSRNYRWRVKNTGAAAGTFRGIFVATSL